MTFSELKILRAFCQSRLFSEPDWREVVSHAGDDDFEVDNVRFISEAAIDRIQQEELASDPYILGCFNDWFLADVLDLDLDVIKAMQEAYVFEALGKLILSMGKLEALQQAYASADGYGHHFNHYDSGEETVNIDGDTYYVFDNH
jgi:hypothetical protein